MDRAIGFMAAVGAGKIKPEDIPRPIPRRVETTAPLRKPTSAIDRDLELATGLSGVITLRKRDEKASEKQ